MSQLPEPASVPEPTAVPEPARPKAADPSATRLVAAIVLGAGLAVLGGFILGEYPFTGLTPYFAGILFALVIAEVLLSISRRQSWITAVAAAVSTAFGLSLAVYISTHEWRNHPFPVGGWTAPLIGIVVALARGGLITGASRAKSNPPTS
jgi:peptidoglycan/LPS O-acetylase OafA/YrhL